MDDKQFYTIIMRHDTSTQWAVNNPILTYGEYAVEDDTHRVKRGDGETEWNELPYEEFGLVYLVTYKNLSGEVSDNQNLQDALDKKMSIAVFDDVNHAVVSSIDIVAENGAIGRLTKITKDIDTAITSSNVILIKSADNSIQGYWSVTNEGVRILNLVANSSITDYEAGHKYYRNQLCYYRNRLYRAVEDFEAESDFNPLHWVILASKHAEDINYDNLSSELDANTVQGALDELKRRNDTKVTKTSEHRVVYGTTQTGAQTVIPIDDLRTVDTVNGISATDQETKNIQIDANDINYDDDAETPETIREKLDQKVDKTVAGEGAKIVRDVQFNYNTETGQIELIEDKFSLEDGSSAEETVVIDVVSEQELSANVNTINDRIDTEVATLNTRVDNEVLTLNNRIDTEVDTIERTIANLDAKVDTQVLRLDTKIDSSVSALNSRMDTEIAALNSTITTQVNRLDGRVDNLTETVANNKADIEAKLTNAQTAINNRIDQEVLTLNNTITTSVNTINGRIDTEVDTLNDRIDTEVADLTTYIDAQDDLKIDKDIADNIVTLLDVATHDSQPTIRVTNKNTRSKQTTYDYVHFTTAGLITTRMEDADHLVIDSTAIDTVNTQQNTRISNAETRLDAHDTSIASLFEHDVNHDRVLATHTSQIADHETRILTLEDDVDNLETDLTAEITNRTTADANLSTRIADNAVRIANNTQAIRDNADSIDQLAQTLEEDVEALTNSKVDKSFAESINNQIVGKLESDTIANTELFNLKQTMISPVNGATSVERIKFISSDNTVIATRQADGTIDLATNLDTDVNYFVTTDIINTTIAAETVLDMDNLTPTDKTVVEIQDIISDPEGTWGRVKAIDTANDECTVVTFKKHAQAVWGTIKGTLADQQDLKTALDSKIESVNGHSTTVQSKAITLGAEDILAHSDDKYGNLNDLLSNGLLTSFACNNVERNRIIISKNYVSGTASLPSVTRGTEKNILINAQENSIGVDIHSVNDMMYIDLVSQPENTVFNPASSGLSSTKISPAIRELKGLIDNLASDLQNQIRLYTQNTQYTASGNYVTQNYLTFENDEGVVIMAKVLKAFTSNNTEATPYESLMKDVELENIKLVGIPEQSDGGDPTPPGPTPSDYEETMEILNDVDGVQDTYDGLGGTEEEVNEILDEILYGNNN